MSTPRIFLLISTCSSLHCVQMSKERRVASPRKASTTTNLYVGWVRLDRMDIFERKFKDEDQPEKSVDAAKFSVEDIADPVDRGPTCKILGCLGHGFLFSSSLHFYWQGSIFVGALYTDNYFPSICFLFIA